MNQCDLFSRLCEHFRPALWKGNQPKETFHLKTSNLQEEIDLNCDLFLHNKKKQTNKLIKEA